MQIVKPHKKPVLRAFEQYRAATEADMKNAKPVCIFRWFTSTGEEIFFKINLKLLRYAIILCKTCAFRNWHRDRGDVQSVEEEANSPFGNDFVDDIIPDSDSEGMFSQLQ